MLYELGDVVALEDGRVAVANRGSSEVLVFGPGGTLAHRIGRAGDGPGEFRAIASVLPMPGDSVGVYDGEHHRLSVFGAEGELGREVSLRSVLPPSSYARLHALAGGDLVVFTGAGFGQDPSEGRPFRPESESIRIGADGTLRTSYGSFPAAELFRKTFEGRGLAGRAHFGARTHAVALGDELVVGIAEATELRAYAPSGRLVRIVRWPDRDRAVTPEHVEALLDMTMEAAPPGEFPPGVREMLASVPHAEALPPYEGLLASDRGDLWVGEYAMRSLPVPGVREPERRWLVFDEGGVLIATVRTPEGFAPHAVREDEVLGVYTDELGVESVRAYGLERESMED